MVTVWPREARVGLTFTLPLATFVGAVTVYRVLPPEEPPWLGVYTLPLPSMARPSFR